MVLQFDTYGRPDEILSLTVSDLTPPVARGNARQLWSVAIRPQGTAREGDAADLRSAAVSREAKPNKQGVYDNSVLVGQEASSLAGRSFVLHLLAFLYQGGHLGEHSHVFRKASSARVVDSTPLFPISYERYCQRIRWGVAELSLDVPGNAHALRHGGASCDAYTGCRTIEEIQERGKWANPASCARYRQSGRYQRILARMTSQQRESAQSIASWYMHRLAYP